MLRGILLALALALLPGSGRAAEPAPIRPEPIRIAVNAEFGVVGSTSAQAVAMGARIAADEVNAAGGVLGGRRLEIIEKDDRSVPARANQNLRELAADPSVVAVLCGRYSPVAMEALPVVHELGLPLLDPWAAADPITEHSFRPDYIFRLSLRDSWAMAEMTRHAVARGFHRLGLLLPNTEWGRSSERAIRRLADKGKFSVVKSQWYHWGDPSLAEQYETLLAAGAEAVVLVANDREGVLLVRELAALPPEKRRPLLSHWGITGGTFFQNAGAALAQVDFAVVQTYSFIGADDPVARRVVAAAKARGAADARAIASPVGVAHAYDLVRILALAIDKAGSAERARVRDALEQVTDYKGLVRAYARPFEPGRHDALVQGNVFMARYAEDGAIVPIPATRR